METSVEQQPAVRVLIVEDNDAQRQILIDLICDEGFDTVVCGTAADALVQAEVGSFHPLSMWVYDRERHVFLDVNGAAL